MIFKHWLKFLTTYFNTPVLLGNRMGNANKVKRWGGVGEGCVWQTNLFVLFTTNVSVRLSVSFYLYFHLFSKNSYFKLKSLVYIATFLSMKKTFLFRKSNQSMEKKKVSVFLGGKNTANYFITFWKIFIFFINISLRYSLNSYALFSFFLNFPLVYEKYFYYSILFIYFGGTFHDSFKYDLEIM